MQNSDSRETLKFSYHAEQWWHKDGPLKTLHDINPLRCGYIEKHVHLADKSLLDVGCGAGILSEAMALRKCSVTAIDTSNELLTVARQHARQSGLEIVYQQAAVETLLDTEQGKFNVICCMELLEHVPDPVSVIASCSSLLADGGHVFFSTINRSALAYLTAIIGAEYILGIIPRGTHEYRQFIRPSELAHWCEQHNLLIDDISGVGYLPFLRKTFFSVKPVVNYLLHARKY